MAAGLSLARADVQTADALFEDVTVLVRQNHVKLSRGAELVAEAFVTGVRRVERRRWELDLDGEHAGVWSVRQSSRRCCGGR